MHMCLIPNLQLLSLLWTFVLSYLWRLFINMLNSSIVSHRTSDLIFLQESRLTSSVDRVTRNSWHVTARWFRWSL